MKTIEICMILLEVTFILLTNIDKRQSIDKSQDQADGNQEVKVEDLFRRKMLMIVELKGLALSITQSNKFKSQNKNQISRDSSSDSLTILKIQLNSTKFGLAQNSDSLFLSMNLQSFAIMNLDTKILHSKSNEYADNFELYEDSKSNQSHSNNQSNSESYMK